nr:unnamed protein product [Callosobruchus analis]
MDTAASTSRKSKHPRQSEPSARYLSEKELQQEAEKIMRGEESDEPYMDFSDSGSQWEPNESSESDSDLNTDNENEENLNPVQNDVIYEGDWQEVNCRNLIFDIIFSGNSWCNDHQKNTPRIKPHCSVYSQFLDPEILELIVQETNRNAEQQKIKKTGLAKKIVLDLTDCYLNQGRTIVTDNYYTSPSLARNLLANETHLLGTLRKNRRGLPPEVIKAKLKKGEITGKEHKDDFVVAKWKDKRDVTFRTTKHGIDMQETGKTNRKGEEVKKPVAILEYNTGKEGVDLSDQMASYFSPLRKTVRWYHRAVFELLLNTAIVNSWIILNTLKGKKISIKQFREETVKILQGVDEHKDLKHEKHTLTETEERTADNRRKRNRCTGCYTKLHTQKGRSTAKQSVTIFLCFTCFTERH